MSQNGNTGNGTSNNTLDYFDETGNTYHRVVDAALNKITSDQQSGTLAPAESQPIIPPLSTSLEFAGVVRLPGDHQIGIKIEI